MLVSQVKNMAIATINGIFALIILLTTNLSRSSLLSVSFLISLSTYGVATVGDSILDASRRIYKPKTIRSSKVVYRINRDDDSLSD